MPNGGHPRTRWFHTACILSLLISVWFTANNLNSKVHAQSTSSFVFTAAGDHGHPDPALYTNGARVGKTMDVVASSSSSFYLALGDLSYVAGGEQSWCNTFKSKFNDVEVLAGNHDVGESSGGSIDEYIRYCPFTLSSPLTGSYGKEYYFDYPGTTPIARFIMIAPGVKGTLNIDYSKTTSPGYIFTDNAIKDARAKGIKWIIVGMHKNCISMGAKTCEVGTPLMNLLINHKVDLVIQSHDHNYQRSHALQCITLNAYDPACVADDGADGSYAKGAGPVIVINGEFARSLYNVSSTDAEAQYFAKSDATTFGISKYTVTDTHIHAEYLRSDGGSFADSFTIADSGLPTPTPLPTATPGGSSAVDDTFDRIVTNGWGSAPTGGAYSLLGGSASNYTADGSAGSILIDTAGSASRNAVLNGVAVQDADIRVRLKTDKAATGSGPYWYVVARRVATGTEYRGRVRVNSTGKVMVQATRVVSGGSETFLGAEGATGVSHSADGYIRVRLQLSSTYPTTLRLKAWADTQAEPTTWQYTVTDSEAALQTAGAVGLRAGLS